MHDAATRTYNPDAAPVSANGPLPDSSTRCAPSYDHPGPAPIATSSPFTNSPMPSCAAVSTAAPSTTAATYRTSPPDTALNRYDPSGSQRYTFPSPSATIPSVPYPASSPAIPVTGSSAANPETATRHTAAPAVFTGASRISSATVPTDPPDNVTRYSQLSEDPGPMFQPYPPATGRTVPPEMAMAAVLP